MSQVRLTITMSLDGFVAGPDQTVEQPLGRGGERLHEWALATRSWRSAHGMSGGETGPDDDAMRESAEGIGATVMGRNMFGPVRGPWGDSGWRGWWGGTPPFRTPVIVLTHHPRESLPMDGGTTFHFVTDGIEAALARARDAAGDLDVGIGGGADTARQYLRAGLVDRVDLHVAPVLLGAGEPLFTPGGGQERLVIDRVISTPAAVHYRLHRAGMP
jgi:dihydrofolate reductase